ncbi:MAG: Lrp/AsnC family transcriptional regulator [Candidatus Methanoplasma sp.]|jgi:DNA-binding Lrp family transcriptional regulator|nr:Lrp/AsnC family transcriptional regulator [Candidatus Methanoplasma sp.]
MPSIDEYDDLDRTILELLINSSQGSFRQMARQLNIHPTTMIQRVKALEAKGVIKGYQARINYANLGYDFCGIVEIHTDYPDVAMERIKEHPCVSAAYEVTGDANLIVLILCLDREEFTETMKFINQTPEVKTTNTSLILNVEKSISDFVPTLRERK